MSVLFTNFRWWKDGSARNMRVSDDGLVTYMGRDEPFADDEIDLEGGWLMPGFVDCHCHIMPTGFDLARLDLSHWDDRRGVLRAVRHYSETIADFRGWFLATHYDQNRFEDGRHLTATEIDEYLSAMPVILRHSSGHACVVNTLALKKAGIDGDTDDPRGGEIVRDDRGNATGVLLENAMELVYRAVPKATKEEMSDAIFAAAKSMSAFGITSAADMMTGHQGLEDEVWAYKNAIQRGAPLRMRLYIQWSEIFKNKITAQELEEMLRPIPEELLAIRGVKLFADGAIGAGTAAMHEEYTTGGNGSFIYPPDELERRVRIADKAGFAIAIHSIGDRCTDLVLDCYEKCADPAKHRIEHVMVLSDNQIARIKSLGCKVTLQPEFLGHFETTYRRRLGDERYGVLKRAKSLDSAGVPVGLSSDRPIVPGNPWTGTLSAASRGDESISVERGVELYTFGAAEVDGDGALFGRLNIRQYADFQVYDRNPLEFEGNVQSVWMGGVQINSSQPS
ncbi:MAG: amidohydrolase [Armatimonadota bacterium]|nr:amidohydrolase [Armatimonadota bacterium]